MSVFDEFAKRIDNPREALLISLREDGSIIQFIPEILGDHEMVLCAYSTYPEVYYICDEYLKDDYEFVKGLIWKPEGELTQLMKRRVATLLVILFDIGAKWCDEFITHAIGYYPDVIYDVPFPDGRYFVEAFRLQEDPTFVFDPRFHKFLDEVEIQEAFETDIESSHHFIGHKIKSIYLAHIMMGKHKVPLTDVIEELRDDKGLIDYEYYYDRESYYDPSQLGVKYDPDVIRSYSSRFPPDLSGVTCSDSALAELVDYLIVTNNMSPIPNSYMVRENFIRECLWCNWNFYKYIPNNFIPEYMKIIVDVKLELEIENVVSNYDELDMVIKRLDIGYLSDENYMYDLITEYPKLFKHVPELSRDNLGLCVKMVKIDNDNIKYVPRKYFKIRSFAEIGAEHGVNLDIIHHYFKTDTKLMMKVIKHDGSYLSSLGLLDDKTMVELGCRNNAKIIRITNFRSDRGMILKIVCDNPTIVVHMDNSLIDDIDFVKSLLCANVNCYFSLPQYLRHDRDICMLCVKLEHDYYWKVPIEYQLDRNFQDHFMIENIKHIDYIPKFKKISHFVEEFVGNISSEGCYVDRDLRIELLRFYLLAIDYEMYSRVIEYILLISFTFRSDKRSKYNSKEMKKYCNFRKSWDLGTCLKKFFPGWRTFDFSYELTTIKINIKGKSLKLKKKLTTNFFQLLVNHEGNGQKMIRNIDSDLCISYN